jgi:hypothetical protein
MKGNKKEKVMIFKCVGSFVNNAPTCDESITTNINDERIDSRAGRYSKNPYSGEKVYYPTSRSYLCNGCNEWNKKWEVQVDKKIALEFAKYF